MAGGWIEWNGGDCPIKSDKARVEYELRQGYILKAMAQSLRWTNTYHGHDIIAYRIIEDHEPMTQTREELTAQIEALQKQLSDMPLVLRWFYSPEYKYFDATMGTEMEYYFDAEIINGVPHIHGIAMKEVEK